MQRLRTTVCVIGAGPAGLVVAQRLHQCGVPCILLERLDAESVSARAKAGMIEPRTVKALESSGLAQPITLRGTRNGVVEFRVEGERYVFDYAALTGGQGHFVYPQHLLVRAWAEAWLEQGGALYFSTEVTSIEPAAQPQGVNTVHARTADGALLSVACDTVVLAAGAGSKLVPDGVQSHEHTYPFRWLTTMIEMAPLGERTIYAPHPAGFAAHLRRSAELTRYYLQVPAADGLASWSDQQIKLELERRLGVEGQAAIRGPIVERDILDLRVRVREPLQRGSVYLAGDAAHLITPAGGKGMNLAIQDALELAEGLIAQTTGGGAERLARYSDTRLPHIWRAQEFSNWMLTLHCGGVLNIHRAEPDRAATYAERIHRAQIERLFTDAGFARWFAHRYAGVDETAA